MTPVGFEGSPGGTFTGPLHIDGRTIQVELVDRMPKGAEDLVGQWSPGEATIRLQELGNPEAENATLLHEIVHVLFIQRDINQIVRAHMGTALAMKRYTPELIDVMEEHITDQLSNGLFQVFRDNPELLRKLASSQAGSPEQKDKKRKKKEKKNA